MVDVVGPVPAGDQSVHLNIDTPAVPVHMSLRIWPKRALTGALNLENMPAVGADPFPVFIIN